MPEFLKSVARFVTADQKDTAPVNSYGGFQQNGAVVLRDRRGTAKAEIPEVTEKGYDGGNPLAIYKPTGAKSVSPQKAMASFNGWTFAAVNAIASEVSNIQLRLYQVKGDDHEEQEDHPLLTLLDGVNERMTGIELKYVTMSHLELTGNCYWLLDGVSDDRTPPRAIYPLDPGRVRVHLQKDVFPYKLDHYTFTIDNKVFIFQPHQILHIKYPDPSDPFVGIGIPQTIPSWIDSDNYAMEYNRTFFINGAQVGLYIQTDTNVEANIERIRTGFGNRHQGVENAHKVPVLPKGAKLEHTGLSQRDMDFSKLTEATRDRILAAFRVSKTILGTAESDTNRACYDDQTEVLTENGWKKYLDVKWGEKIAEYDPTNESIRFVEPLGSYVYKYAGKMIHFESEETDILVTPDHRMWFRPENESEYRIGYAEDVPEGARFKTVAQEDSVEPSIREQATPQSLKAVDYDGIVWCFKTSTGLFVTRRNGKIALQGNTAETADYVFSKRTIKPKMLMVISYLNEFLVPRYGDDLYLTFIDPTPDDKAARTAEMTAAAGTGVPIMTQNEARKSYLGLGPIDGGDKLMIPAALSQAGVTQEVGGEDQTPQLAKSKTVDGWETKTVRVRTGGKTANSGAAQMRRALTEAFKKAIEKEPAYQFKSINELTHAEYEEHWKRFADRSEQAEADLQKVFRGINAKQREQVLENLDGATVDMLSFVANATKALSDLFDPKEWIGITIDLATPILTSLSKDEAAAAFAMIGASSQNILANESTQAALNRGIAKMATSYNETTLDQLKNVLGEKLTQPGGTNLTELTQAVDGVYSYADERRAGLIAKTESFRAANWANREAWTQSGVVKSLKFYTAEDEKVCSQCQDLDGTVVGIEDKFFNDDYSDGMSPPVHPDCFTGDTIIVSPDAERALRMDYSGDIFEIDFADGTRISVTPNHPILTQRGFVAARLLKQGDKAIKVLLDNGIVLGDPDNESTPASIGEVFSALGETSGMTTTSVPVSSEYFHGDAKRGQGDISIITADGLLGDNLDSSTPQPIRKALLNRTGIALSSLNAKSDVASVLLALALSSDGIVSGDGVAPVLLGSAPSHEDSIRLKSAANYNARIQKSVANSLATYSEGLRDAQLSLSGAITTNDVVAVQRKPFHGYVYDVTAMSTVYIANGIVTSNCRCFIRPDEIG